MHRLRDKFLFLNLGHFLDHFFMLIFATVAALQLSREWGLTYSELIPYATPGFIAFGVCALPAGWLADRWSRDGMLVVFFIGIGMTSILCGLTGTPFQLGFALTLMGVFAAIYHPVGLALVIEGREKTGLPLAINGVFGNLGVASAALITGYLIDLANWRYAFVTSGALSIVLGVGYWYLFTGDTRANDAAKPKSKKPQKTEALDRGLLLRIFAIILLTTAIGGLIFQSTTFALPELFEERLSSLTDSATMLGWYAFIVFSIAALAQVVVGYLVDRVSIKWVFICIALTQAFFLALAANAEGVTALLLSIGFMLAVFGQIPINDVLIGRISAGEWRSRAFALRYIVTFSVMASTLPLIAWIHAEWGFGFLLQLLAAAAVCIFIAVTLLPGQSRLAGQSG